MTTKTQQKQQVVGQHGNQSAAKESGAADQGKAATTSSPQHQDIQARAYDIFQKRIHNGHTGDQTADWLQAEREIAESHATSASHIEAKALPREEKHRAETR